MQGYHVFFSDNNRKLYLTMRLIKSNKNKNHVVANILLFISQNDIIAMNHSNLIYNITKVKKKYSNEQ